MSGWRDDLLIKVIRPENKGGQHVGVRIDPVRVTHEPTGIMAQCGEMRSQHRNKQIAVEMIEWALVAMGWDTSK